MKFTFCLNWASKRTRQKTKTKYLINLQQKIQYFSTNQNVYHYQTYLKLFMSGNSWKIQLSGHTHNDLNSCNKQNSAIYNLKMGTMSASFVLVFKLEAKYPFISIETKKTKTGNSRHILPWNKNLFGERKREIMTHCPWV